MPAPQPHRALPGPMIDLIRDGVPSRALRERGGAAVWVALVSTAMSAHQRGWGFPEWAAVVSETRSVLGRQARLDRGRRDIGPRRYERTLNRAWEAAQRAVEESPAQTAQEVKEAVDDAIRWLDHLPESAWTLPPRDRLVLRWVLEEASKRGMTRPATPARAVETSTGVPRAEVSRALARLRAGGWIELHAPGRRGEGGSGKASLHTIRPARAIALLRAAGAARSPEPPTGAYVPNLEASPPPMSQTAEGQTVPSPPLMSQTEETTMIAVTTDPATGQVTATVPAGSLSASIQASLEALRAAGVAIRHTAEPEPEEARGRVIDLASRRAVGGAR